MLRPLTFYYREYRPSTLYYKFVKHVYTIGYRPKRGSIFYSPVLAKESKWLHWQ